MLLPPSFFYIRSSADWLKGSEGAVPHEPSVKNFVLDPLLPGCMAHEGVRSEEAYMKKGGRILAEDASANRIVAYILYRCLV